MAEKEMQELLTHKAGVEVYMGSHFGEKFKGYFRINTAVPRKNLEELLSKIAAAIL